MDKLRAMQAVVAIAEAGSLTAAARDLETSLPALVRLLARLEHELGVRLFNRTTRRLAPTEEGRRYVERSRQVLTLVGEAEAELLDEAIEPQGSVRMTAPVLFGQLHVCAAVARFVDHYPAVNVDMQLLDRVVNLVDEGFDLGVRIGMLENSTMVARRVGSVRRLVVATPDYLARHGIPAHPRDLIGHECLRFTGASAPQWTFVDKGRALAVPVRGPLSINQAAPLAQACIAGLGIGMFISYQIADALRAGLLLPILEEFALPAQPIHIIYPQARLLPTRTRVLIDWLAVDIAAAHPESSGG